MEKKIVLSPKKILNKEFQIDIKGYNMEQVDYFLDMVKSDYENFAVLLNEAYEELDKLSKENESLTTKLYTLEQERLIQQDTMNSMEEQLASNVDILKRLSNLEKEVFKR